MNRLKAKYNEEIIPSLREKFNYENVMDVPKLDKIVVNMDTMKEESRTQLKRWNVRGDYNRYK